jgi:glyoxylase-like metal-dependent hydrolase (beta-lactamase superfamily II)
MRPPAAWFAAALALLLAAPRAVGDEVPNGPVAAPPGAAQFALGALELTSLADGGFVSPIGIGDYGSDVGQKAVAQVLARAGAATDRVALSVDALLVRAPGHLVLLDAGLGPTEHGALPQSLGLAGVSPAQITDVLITHGHLDHVGGLVGTDGRTFFPNARIWVSEKEWASMKTHRSDAAIVRAIAPQVMTFTPGGAILPGMTPRALYGHTPGHVGYEITSEGRTIEDIGDVAHSSIVDLAHPEWRGGIDEDPDAAAVTRVAELARLAARHELVFSPHFPFPGVGWIERSGQGYVWRPDRRVRVVVTAKTAG